MSYLSDVRAAVAAKATPIVRAVYPRLPETIAVSPALVLGQMTWTTTPGNRELTVWSFPLELYVARAASDDRTIAAADELIEALRSAYAQGITLASTGSTAQAVIRGGRADEWPTIGTGEFLLVTLDLEVTQHVAREYTA